MVEPHVGQFLFLSPLFQNDFAKSTNFTSVIFRFFLEFFIHSPSFFIHRITIFAIILNGTNTLFLE